MSGTPTSRFYQTDAVNAILGRLQKVDSTLLVMATGLGKTQVGCSVAQSFLPGKVLWLSHRQELVRQGADRLALVTGEQVEIEMAELWASLRSRVVSASLDTIRARLDRWPPDHFSLVVFDEAHHLLAKSYLKVWQHFKAKKLAMTATPDRGDKKALGRAVGDCAGVWDIVDGIEHGYLVPIVGRSIEVDSIDLSNIPKSAGDLQVSALEDEMVKSNEGMVAKTLELFPDRRGIWFFPGVRSAELACDRIRALGKTCAFVSGATPKEEREQIMKGFRDGTYQHLTNCQVATEGFDAPGADMVVICRPTLSRALYAQMVGRGLRVLPGCVDSIPGVERSVDRREAIVWSPKPDCVVVDFCGNAGKHTLMTPEDVLGGDEFTDEEKALAKKKAKEEPGSDVLENLAKARAEIKAMMLAMKSQVKAKVVEFDPFSVLHVSAPTDGVIPSSPSQRDALAKYGVTPGESKKMTKEQAKKLLASCHLRAQRGLASYKQLKILRKHGVDKINVSFKKASSAIEYISRSGWRPDPTTLQSLLR